MRSALNVPDFNVIILEVRDGDWSYWRSLALLVISVAEENCCQREGGDCKNSASNLPDHLGVQQAYRSRKYGRYLAADPVCGADDMLRSALDSGWNGGAPGFYLRSEDGLYDCTGKGLNQLLLLEGYRLLCSLP